MEDLRVEASLPLNQFDPEGRIIIDLKRKQIVIQADIGVMQNEKFMPVETVTVSAKAGPGSMYNAIMAHLFPPAYRQIFLGRVRSVLLYQIELSKKMAKNALQDDIDELTPEPTDVISNIAKSGTVPTGSLPKPKEPKPITDDEIIP